jgi:hypothetical protein
VAQGKITEPIGYQDSRGFVVYSNELYKQISSQMAQENPEAHKAIDTSRTAESLACGYPTHPSSENS